MPWIGAIKERDGVQDVALEECERGECEPAIVGCVKADR